MRAAEGRPLGQGPVALDLGQLRHQPDLAASSAGPGEHGVEHGCGQLAGEGVLLARVVGADHRSAVAGRRLDAVTEPGPPPEPAGPGPARRRRTGRAPRGPAPSRAGPAPAPGTGRQRSRSAGVGRLAGGAQRTEAVTQTPSSRRPSSGPHRGRLVGEPAPVERGEQPVAGAVAGEHPPGSVAAVGGRGQADDDDRRRRDRRSREPGGPSTPRPGTRPGGSRPPPPARPPAGAGPAGHDLILEASRAVRPAPGRPVHPRDTRLARRDAAACEADGAPSRSPSALPPRWCCWCGTAPRRAPARCCRAGRPACTWRTPAREQAARLAESPLLDQKPLEPPHHVSVHADDLLPCCRSGSSCPSPEEQVQPFYDDWQVHPDMAATCQSLILPPFMDRCDPLQVVADDTPLLHSLPDMRAWKWHPRKSKPAGLPEIHHAGLVRVQAQT